MNLDANLLLDIDLLKIQKLTKVVYDKYGYDFRNYALSSFKRRIARILESQKLNNIDDLIEKLETTPIFFHQFLSSLTVNVTEMFRDPTFWLYLQTNILPNIINKQGKINIWHAGCSSGEEVYSMMIALKELGIDDQFNVLASDMDTDILQKAKLGKYPAKNLITSNRNYLEAGGKKDLSHYTTEKDSYVYINKELKEHITFVEHNLVTDNIQGKFDLILCRNVLIYFNQTLQNTVLDSIQKSLLQGGYLAIGSKESLLWCESFTKFKTINTEDKLFQKNQIDCDEL